ncbi:MAG: hypothetical protein F6K32_18860 [Desertifilum sp. SIO1I2]|nr:hypothetical protein [Desertifilum sp. SIO1I2]
MLNTPLSPWQLQSEETYVPICYEGKTVGFCSQDSANRIIKALNDREKVIKQKETLFRAMQLVCLDLLRVSGGDLNQVNEVMRKYVEKIKRPKHGSKAIAFLLRDRQMELDVSDKEFVRFCDSYKLSLPELREIYNGNKPVNDEQLRAIARIVGKTFEELKDVRDGFSESELRVLAKLESQSAPAVTDDELIEN